MTKEDVSQRIKAELSTLKSKQVALDNTYRHRWHSGTTTFDLLDDVERVRKRRVELEDTLRVMDEFKSEMKIV